jgi:hypothetical protein
MSLNAVFGCNSTSPPQISCHAQTQDDLYRAQESFVNFDSARQSQIEAQRADRRSPAPSGQGEEEARFGEVTASQNMSSLTTHGISSKLPPNETFADSTYLKINGKSAKLLGELKSKVGISKIFEWIGYGHYNKKHYLYREGEGGKIPMRDARLINENANQTIIGTDDLEDLVVIKVINAAQNSLASYNKKINFSEASTKLEFHPNYLFQIKDGNILKISVKKAKKIEEFFGGAEIFCIRQIFDRARQESIRLEGVKGCDLLTTIELNETSRREIDKFPHNAKVKLRKLIGSKQFYLNQAISLRNAIVINEIADSKIVDYSVEILKKIPCLKEVQEKISDLFEEKQKEKNFSSKRLQSIHHISLKTMRAIIEGKQKQVSYETAVNFNTYFGDDRLFDFAVIIEEGKKEALAFYNQKLQSLQETDSPKKCHAMKRKANQTIKEEEAAPDMKRQKTDVIPSSADDPSLHSAEYFNPNTIFHNDHMHQYTFNSEPYPASSLLDETIPLISQKFMLDEYPLTSLTEEELNYYYM